jgi:hypothetical protein
MGRTRPQGKDELVDVPTTPMFLSIFQPWDCRGFTLREIDVGPTFFTLLQLEMLMDGAISDRCD